MTRALLIALLAMLVSGCAGSAVRVGATPFERILQQVNARLRRPALQSVATYRLESSGTCRVIVHGRWSAASAAAKRFATVDTATPVQFGADIASIRRVAPYDDQFANHLERWSDHVRIRFVRPLAGRFMAARRGERASVEIYTADFLSIGISPGTPADEMDGLVGALTALDAVCARGDGA
jgi:hypothetical protein